MVKFDKKVEKKFTPYWEQRQLEDAVEDYVVKTTIENQYPILTSSQQKGIILQEEYFSGERTSKSGNIGYFILPRGYFAYRSRSDNDTYVFNRNDCIDKGIISYFYPVFRPKNTDSNFLLRRLNTGMQRQLLIASEGTGQHVLSLKKFKNMKTNFPCIEEQQKVGELFQSLDRTITLHEEKQKQLEQLKKGLSQKLFADKIGFPEIRFKGFGVPWEQCKFGNLFKFLQNNTLSRASLNNENGYGQNVHYGDVLIKYHEILDTSKIRLDYIPSKDTVDKYKKSFLENGDIIIADTAEDETVGKCTEILGLTKQKVISGLHTIPVRPKRKFAPGYLGFYLNSNAYHNQLRPLMQGIKVTSISKSSIKNTKVMYPVDLDEQDKISKMLINMDSLISANQQKIDQLKSLKQALLQQMFI